MSSRSRTFDLESDHLNQVLGIAVADLLVATLDIGPEEGDAEDQLEVIQLVDLASAEIVSTVRQAGKPTYLSPRALGFNASL